MNNEKITLLTTAALDKIIYEKTGQTKTQDGGPAFYISRVAEKFLGNYQNITHDTREVTILVNNRGEFGKIDNQTPPTKVDFSNIKTPYLLISTVLKDFDLSNISNYKGFVFLDIQGYVRDGSDFGKKKIWNPPKETQEKIDCLVGTTEELSFLPNEVIEKQKEKILIETKGKNGVNLFIKKKFYEIKPKIIFGRLSNTIGAGDTFLVNFAAEFIRERKALESVKFAVDQVTNFLKSKN